MQALKELQLPRRHKMQETRVVSEWIQERVRQGAAGLAKVKSQTGGEGKSQDEEPNVNVITRSCQDRLE